MPLRLNMVTITVKCKVRQQNYPAPGAYWGSPFAKIAGIHRK